MKKLLGFKEIYLITRSSCLGRHLLDWVVVTWVLVLKEHSLTLPEGSFSKGFCQEWEVSAIMFSCMLQVLLRVKGANDALQLALVFGRGQAVMEQVRTDSLMIM